jgi:hypothetical protein
MLALAVVLSAIVLLLGVLVAGLLRSHADILQSLHELGVGVGDPTAATHGQAGPHPEADGVVRIGPPLPSERQASAAPTVGGVTPAGDAVAVAPASGDGLTLLAFLSAGCGTCGTFWSALSDPRRSGFPDGVRTVVVTKGPELESPAAVAGLAPAGLLVVMSSAAWTDYEVPGSPFFVLVDAERGRRVGEGVANQPAQVAELVRRAVLDARHADDTAGGAGRRSRRRAPDGDRLDGPGRERANDRELLAAGVRPGDPSLYPTSVADLYGPEAGTGDDPRLGERA